MKMPTLIQIHLNTSLNSFCLSR